MSLINDVRDELKSLDLSRKSLTSFVIVILVAATIGWYFLYQSTVAGILFPVLMIYLIAGWFFNPILKPFYLIWMSLAFTLGWFMSRLLLSVVYYVILTPIGFFLRMTGKTFLEKSFNKNADSYWIKKTNKIDYTKMS
jgi:hypothetical protein